MRLAKRTGVPLRQPHMRLGKRASIMRGRNYLTGRDGDKTNAILAGAGYNYRLVPSGCS